MLSSYKQIWENIYPVIEDKGYSARYVVALQHSVQSFLKLTEASELKDFEEVKFVKIFIKNMTKANIKETTQKNLIARLSSIVESFINAKGFEELEHEFEKNPFKYIISKRKFQMNTVHYPARTKEEVELWISTIPKLEIKLAFTLGAMGLRNHEIFRLTKKQFDLDERLISNVLRKGNDVQQKLGIPLWLIDMLEIRLNRIDSKDTLISKTRNTIFWIFKEKHFADLMKMKKQIELDSNLTSKWSEVLATLTLIEKNGPIVVHSLRSSWDTISSSNKMNENYRRFHLNHRLKGMDDTYVQIYSNPTEWKKYLKELDDFSVQYDFGEV